ncbi:hypothetical protein HPB48_023222 [Haemaphysalis longicornis]|uniref:Reverse transcriptase n=1 Tax=Haemaphysalis longicornis TaxID=44386 RepID=A0A9J6H7G3_HAELO|nr:hypothetical protein HPB48_023222 [Haemaphysalis longicornis]
MTELHAALASANPRSAPGLNNVTVVELRNHPESSVHLRLDGINRDWMTGTFPGAWRDSLVKPIPKLGKPPNDLANLRHISLTSNLCKLFQRMVLERFSWPLKKTAVLLASSWLPARPTHPGYSPHSASPGPQCSLSSTDTNCGGGGCP